MRPLVALVLCSCWSAACARVFDPSSPAGAVLASNAFGLELYRKVKADDQNLICSPASASIALAMATAGARGETQAEMARVLHLDRARLVEGHASFGSLLTALNERDGQDGLIVHVADRLWAQSGVDWKAGFEATLADHYGAAFQSVDFAHAADAARGEINAWAAHETHDRIPQVFGPGTLGGNTRLVLANAVYFKGVWVDDFNIGATRDLPFVTPAGHAPTKMMARLLRAKYAELDDVKVVELPYKGRMSLVVVLPDDPAGLPAAEAHVGAYDRWIDALRDEQVDLQLPRWKTRSSIELSSKLAELGMPRAFSGGDFSGMTDTIPVVVDQVIQAAFIEVDESGTEAAAVTAMEIVEVSAISPGPPPPKVFHADHPFLFFIRDQVTGAILFMGRVVDPRV